METVIAGDLTIPSAAPRPCERLGLSGSLRTVEAVISRGVWEGVHHIEVRESDDEVIVTAYVGTLRAIVKRQEQGEVLTFVMKAVLQTVRIELPTPLGGRSLRDGAVDADRA